jgi:hypothetical protein
MLSIFLATWSMYNDTRTKLRTTSSQLMEQRRRLQTSSGVGKVTGFRLINATIGSTGQVLVDPLIDGAIINLSMYPSNQGFSIEARASNVSGPIGSVKFAWLNRTDFRTENVAPYMLCGDNGITFYACSFLAVGSHTYFATPYSLTKAGGIIGTRRMVQFTIVQGGTTPAPTNTPTKAPTKVPTNAPTKLPTNAPTKFPSKAPTKVPTNAPTKNPTKAPTSASKATGPPGWVVVNPNATLNARHEACFVMVGRKAYLLAGRNINPVNIYDPVTRNWTNGAAPPIQLHHTQCVAVDNDIWLVSPWTGGFPMEKLVGNTYVSTLNA